MAGLLGDLISSTAMGAANVLEIDLGMKGAALAAFGDIEGAFFASFGVRKEGVKLGESTLNVFFMLLKFRHKM